MIVAITCKLSHVQRQVPVGPLTVMPLAACRKTYPLYDISSNTVKRVAAPFRNFLHYPISSKMPRLDRP